ncbi:NAD(P)/FAD-dependent oxidoreductase [Azohydromonas caseinilytica]|uniref:NAD(P)-binding protein n=1 Tax=Azohydromonas caseinilytica TaxID=2728836 RepID=A0A848F3J4_9BURK|nr:NAD(P)-binding protein [Azohydromonas caseinilytica]NML13962.1 NAD(P)-binding protein [Azohydromonas caseinilytica]
MSSSVYVPARPPRVAVVGAGLAGITCARRLSEAGCAVQLFDKSRGVGGRMATRRVEWIDTDGAVHRAAFDHGAPAFSARSAAFRAFIDEAVGDGVLRRWEPVMAPGSHANLDGLAHWVATPDMPALCRHLAAGLPLTRSCTVDELVRDRDGGWRLLSQGDMVGDGVFDAVVLAMPPAQAAVLLALHRDDWARQAWSVPMQPCWTLMGAEGGTPPPWDAAWPQRGPLAWIVRNASKPGRAAEDDGLTRWVVHATAEWSATFLESASDSVQSALQEALARELGRTPRWAHVAVHRWRYALAPRRTDAAGKPCWWDAALGLGVCGDFFTGAGVEGAWLSGRALAAAIVPATADARAPGR